MKKIFLRILLLISLSSCTSQRFTLDQLQGAWWSDTDNPTADFFIDGNQVWLDYDSDFHPCRIEEDLLIFDLGEDLGLVKNRIIDLSGNRLVLENTIDKEKQTLIRK